jgi:hypothetical protein
MSLLRASEVYQPFGIDSNGVRGHYRDTAEGSRRERGTSEPRDTPVVDV